MYVILSKISRKNIFFLKMSVLSINGGYYGPFFTSAVTKTIIHITPAGVMEAVWTRDWLLSKNFKPDFKWHTICQSHVMLASYNSRFDEKRTKITMNELYFFLLYYEVHVIDKLIHTKTLITVIFFLLYFLTCTIFTCQLRVFYQKML